LAHEEDTVLFVERDDRDGPRVAADLAAGPRPVRALDRVDAERQVVALVEDLGLDDPFFQRVGRLLRAGRTAQAVTCFACTSSERPVSVSKTWSLSSGRRSVS
jgi:hypothetical protein